MFPSQTHAGRIALALALAALLLAGTSLALAAQRDRSAGDGAAAAPAAKKPRAPLPPSTHPVPAAIDDDKVFRSLETQANKLIEDGKTVPMADLVAQLGRLECTAALAKPSGKPLAPADLYERCRKSVLIMAPMYKCNKCTKLHPSPASGFILTESGLAVTNHHVVKGAKEKDAQKDVTLVAMTFDGRVHPVKAVVAASAATDVAIVQLDGTGFTPLPVAAEAAVGSDVFVLSHPDGCFFTLTRGIVSRYASIVREKRKVPMLQITAAYAKGSSGGPVLSAAGEVVGMVSSTVSIYYKDDHGKQQDLQMVLNEAVPSAHILDLIRGP